MMKRKHNSVVWFHICEGLDPPHLSSVDRLPYQLLCDTLRWIMPRALYTLHKADGEALVSACVLIWTLFVQEGACAHIYVYTLCSVGACTLHVDPW